MNMPTNQEKSPVAAFGKFMEKMKPQMALALPRHMNADRMARLAMTAFSTSPSLQQCTPNSIAASIMIAGQLGLEPGVNGAGYLIPYKTTCTFVPGWKGLVDLVSRSGRGTVYTGVIFSDQEYTFIDGAKRDLIIHNETDLDDPDDITHAYAIGWVKDATMPIIELWSVEKIRKHRDKYNKVGSKHYSFRDWEMYCRKVPLLQVLKYMPASIELSNAIDISNAQEMGRGVTIENGVVVTDEQYHDPDTYTEDRFVADFPNWEKLILSGKKTADEVIATAGSKANLNDEQKAKIRAVKKSEPKLNSGITFAWVSDKLNQAADVDLLDAAADLIREVADEKQREELTVIYQGRREALSQ